MTGDETDVIIAIERYLANGKVKKETRLVLELLRASYAKMDRIEQAIGENREWVNGLKSDADATHAKIEKRIDGVENSVSLYNKLHGAVSGALLALQTYLAALR